MGIGSGDLRPSGEYDEVAYKGAIIEDRYVS
jgi:hypothetical protein